MRLSEAGIARYKAKLPVLVLFYLLAPAPPRRQSVPSPSPNPPLVPLQLGKLEPGSTLVQSSRPGADVAEAVSLTVPFDGENDRSTHVVSHAGLTSTDRALEWASTPALSEPPRATSVSTLSQALRGPPAPSAFPPGHLPWLTPFTFTMILLHALFFLQCVSDASRATISQKLLSNPLPPPFRTPDPSPSRSTSSTSRLSLSKRLARFRWKVALVWDRLGVTPAIQALLAVVLFAPLAEEVYGAVRASDSDGWNGVFELGSGTVAQLRRYETPATRRSAKWLEPCRDLALLELLSSTLIAVYALSPLFLALNLVPTSVRAPRQMLRKRSRALLVPTSYLLPRYLAFSLSSIQLVQTLVLVLSRSASTYRFLSLATVVTLYELASSVGLLLVVREALERDFERTLFLIDEFPRNRVTLGRAHGGDADSTDRDSRLDELESESCAICFEDDFGPALVASFRSRCYLTHCGHTVHASCLYEWFQRQSFCPTCHEKVPVLSTFPLAESAVVDERL
ncbi:hypothetical protein JCM11491_000647 [Sporobolomyces phaffii]